MTGWIRAMFCVAGLTMAMAGARAQEPVDVTLVLAVDVSRSMSPRELEIQRDGYAAALNHPDVIRAIGQGAYGKIAVTMFEWAGNFAIKQVFDWTLVANADDADRLSAVVRDSRPVAQRRTSISGAIQHALARLEASPYEGFRKVIDISGDGPNNQGDPVLEAREMALANRIVINGLPLMTSDGPGSGFNIAELDVYYSECVIGGPGSFIVPVSSWEQFPEAIRRKLIQEIGGLAPLSGTVIPAQSAPIRPMRTPSGAFDCLIGEKIWEQRQWMFDDR